MSEQVQVDARQLILDQLARLPSTLARADVETAIARFAASYGQGDVAGRVALCAPTVTFEDPVGITVAHDRDELEAMWTGVAASGIALEVVPERVVVVGHEALVMADMEVRPADGTAARLALVLHLTFGGDGLVTAIRAFFDADSIS
jgi:hypothetical protein